MEYAYKFRLYPNEKQEIQIAKTFGCCRFIYNYFLAQRRDQYKATGHSPTRKLQSGELPVLKKTLPWLKEADSTALQSAVKNLDAAFQNFFRSIQKGDRQFGYPRFKSKKNRNQSYTSVQVRNNVKVFEKAVQLPKLGLVECRVSKKVEGRILSATVSRTPSGKYFVSICCTDVDLPPLPKTGLSVGLDLGIKSFCHFFKWR